MEQFDEFDAIIKIRSGGAFVPRIDVLGWDGRRVRAQVAWPIEDHESSIYKGEFACQIEDHHGERFPRGWIASGDLVVISS